MGLGLCTIGRTVSWGSICREWLLSLETQPFACAESFGTAASEQSTVIPHPHLFVTDLRLAYIGSMLLGIYDLLGGCGRLK